MTLSLESGKELKDAPSSMALFYEHLLLESGKELKVELNLKLQGAPPFLIWNPERN